MPSAADASSLVGSSSSSWVQPLWGYPRGSAELAFRRGSGTAQDAGLLAQGETRWSVRRRFAMADPQLLRALAASFLAGEQTVEQVLIRGEQTLGRSWPWLRPLAHRYSSPLRETRPRLRDVVKFLNEDAGSGAPGRSIRTNCRSHSY